MYNSMLTLNIDIYLYLFTNYMSSALLLYTKKQEKRNSKILPVSTLKYSGRSLIPALKNPNYYR